MKSEEIRIDDWMRIVFGEVPPLFYLELVIRAMLAYLLLVTSMRILGKRMATHISRLELAALVCLASAIGVPLLAYDRGILPSFIVAFIVVSMSRLLSYFSIKSQNFEQVTQGDLDTLVTDGVMNIDKMERTRIPRERLFAQLRSENIFHLGAVKRLYLEANGSFSLILNEESKPGLSVLPPWDNEFIEEMIVRTNIRICEFCGKPEPEENYSSIEMKCNNCGSDIWTTAVVEKSSVEERVNMSY